jgi:hypothetical protein
MGQPDPRVVVEFCQEGEHWPSSGRVSRMIRWLCENEETVNRIGKGELRFCFAGDSLSAHVTIVDNNL